MVEKDGAGLEESEKMFLYQWLLANSDVFSSSGTDLGRTGVTSSVRNSSNVTLGGKSDWFSVYMNHIVREEKKGYSGGVKLEERNVQFLLFADDLM